MEFAEAWVRSAILAMSSAGAAIPVFVGAHVLFSVMLLPCSFFAVTAGLLWGLWPGLAISVGAAILASTTTFCIGRAAQNRFHTLSLRFPFRDSARSVIARLSGNRQRWLIVLAAYSNPLLPSSSFGYVCGYCKIPAPSFLIGALIGILPLQTALVSSGALMQTAVMPDAPAIVEYVILGSLLVSLMLCVIILVSRASTEETDS